MTKAKLTTISSMPHNDIIFKENGLKCLEKSTQAREFKATFVTTHIPQTRINMTGSQGTQIKHLQGYVA